MTRRRQTFVAVAALLGCEAWPQPGPLPAVQAATSPATRTGLVSVRQVRGRVIGHDGLVPEFAALSLSRLDRPQASVRALLAPDGAFAFDLDADAAMVGLRIDAVEHMTLQVALDGRDPDLELEIRLGSRPGPGATPVAQVFDVIVRDDPWSPEAGGLLPMGAPAMVPLAPAGDRVWTASLPGHPHGALYGWMDGPMGGPLPLPAGAADHVAPFGQVWAFAPAHDGQVTLRIDASRLPAAVVPPEISIVGEAPATAAMLVGWRAGLEWADAPGDDATICTAAAAAARTLTEPTGAPLWIAYAAFAARRPCKISAADARAATLAIPAEDPRWDIAYAALRATLDALAAEDRAQADAFEAAVVDRHPNPHLAARLLYERLVAAKDDGPRARALLARLREPRFAGTSGRYAAILIDPDRVDVGRPTPEFSLPALDGGPPISRASLLGKPHVIDFWATWCGPCVAMLPEMHAAWAEVLGVPAPADAAGWRGLARTGKPAVEFVSISVNEPVSAVKAYRAEEWPMPWRNAVADGESDALKEQFGVTAVPAVLFVGADGVIVQRDGDFEAGLRKLLGPRRGG